MYTRVDTDEVWHVAAVVAEVAAALRLVRERLAEAEPSGWCVTHDLSSRVGAVLAELDSATTAGSAGGEALAAGYVAAAQGYQDADELRRPR